MSTAARVPETWELTGDDAQGDARSTGRVRLLQSAFTRFRVADGTSHSRSLAFATSLVLVQGIVVLVGLRGGVRPVGGSAHDRRDDPQRRARALRATCSPRAVGQANRVGNQDRFLRLTLGLVGHLITSTTAMGQMERGLNRIYGIEKDRPTGQKYALAFVLTLTVGTGLGIAFSRCSRFGRSIGRSWGHEARVAWEILRWPIGLALIAVCLAALLSRLGQPASARPRLARIRLRGRGRAVGPVDDRARARVPARARTSARPTVQLAGIVALQLWTVLSSFSIFYGVSVAAELEAIRAGAGEPHAARPEASAPRARASLQG